MLERNKKTLDQNREKRDKCWKTAAAAATAATRGAGESMKKQEKWKVGKKFKKQEVSGKSRKYSS